MATRIEVHPTAKIAVYAVAIALVGSFAILGAKRLLRRDAPTPLPPVTASNISVIGSAGDLLLPVVELHIADAALEAQWSAALASALGGRTEAPVEGGRVDVLTEHYAIEVDRFDKWHEAIGQAAHYALKTGKVPVAAIMIPSELWPVSPATKGKLLLIDETCSKQGIKLVLLRRSAP